jgi:hypothetical protein
MGKFLFRGIFYKYETKNIIIGLGRLNNHETGPKTYSKITIQQTTGQTKSINHSVKNSC